MFWLHCVTHINIFYCAAVTAVLRPVYALWQYNSSAEGFQLQAEIHYPQQNLLYPSNILYTPVLISMHTTSVLVFVLPNLSPHIQAKFLGESEMGVGSVPGNLSCLLVGTVTCEILRFSESHSPQHQTILTLTHTHTHTHTHSLSLSLSLL